MALNAKEKKLLRRLIRQQTAGMDDDAADAQHDEIAATDESARAAISEYAAKRRAECEVDLEIAESLRKRARAAIEMMDS